MSQLKVLGVSDDDIENLKALKYYISKAALSRTRYRELLIQGTFCTMHDITPR